MVNFLHLSSPCQCLPLIYVGQLKMESSVPKLNWGKNTAWERICLWDMFSKALRFYTEHFRIPSCLFVTPTSRNRESSTQTEKWKASVIEVSCLYYCLQRFFRKLSGHLHLVRSSTSLLTAAVCFLSKYHRGNILHWERYKQFPTRDGCPDSVTYVGISAITHLQIYLFEKYLKVTHGGRVPQKLSQRK